MSGPRGYLLVTMEPPPAMEEEFNDWYDDEHLPERSAIEGFDTSLRYVCVNGWPRYLAFYDLRDAQVLEESGYKAVSGNHFSPWSKRILPRVRGQYRAAGDQVYPGQARAQPCSRLLMLRFRNAGASAQDVVIGGARELFEGQPGVSQVRVFRYDHSDTSDFIAMVEASRPFDLPALQLDRFRDATSTLDLINEYVQHWVRGHLPGVYDAQAH